MICQQVTKLQYFFITMLLLLLITLICFYAIVGVSLNIAGALLYIIFFFNSFFRKNALSSFAIQWEFSLHHISVGVLNSPWVPEAQYVWLDELVPQKQQHWNNEARNANHFDSEIQSSATNSQMIQAGCWLIQVSNQQLNMRFKLLICYGMENNGFFRIYHQLRLTRTNASIGSQK